MTRAPAALSVDMTGMYRITGTWLRARGIDWNGIPAADLALVRRGRPVQRLISPPGALSSKSTLTLFGQAENTHYTRRAVYYMRIDPRLALPMPRFDASPGTRHASASYRATYIERRRHAYDPLAPGDGWFYDQAVAAGGPSDTSAHFSLFGLVEEGDAALMVRVRGVSALPGTGPQHHIVIALNGHRLIEDRFSGTGFVTLRASFPAHWLRPSDRLRVLLPGDVHNADNVDAVDLQTYSVRYPRRFIARGGRLAARLAGQARVTVTGFRSPSIDVWRTRGPRVVMLAGMRVVHSGRGFTTSFVARQAGVYRAVERDALMQPAGAWSVPPNGYLTRGRAGMLVIAPRAFLSALDPLVAYHRRRGLTVKLAAAEDIYIRFGDGSESPAAVRRMILFARAHLGTRYVLLAGGDTDDPLGYRSCRPATCPANPHDRSLIPSLYVRDSIGQVPSDERYVAGPGDRPLVAIGRIPAVNRTQVAAAVAATLGFLAASHTRPDAVLASGAGDPTFPDTNDALRRLFPATSHVIRADAGRIGARAARARLRRSIDGGAWLVSFVGHGNLEEWGNPPALLSVQDVRRLHARSPGIFLGWGCQTAYYLDPTDAALNARLLFARYPAALAIGSTGAEVAEPQERLARMFLARLLHGASVGESLRLAETQLLRGDSNAAGTVNTYEIFGDPALSLRPSDGSGEA